MIPWPQRLMSCDCCHVATTFLLNLLLTLRQLQPYPYSGSSFFGVFCCSPPPSHVNPVASHLFFLHWFRISLWSSRQVSCLPAAFSVPQILVFLISPSWQVFILLPKGSVCSIQCISQFRKILFSLPRGREFTFLYNDST